MSDLTPQQIAAWFRERAKKFNEMADFTETTFACPPMKFRRTVDSSVPTPNGALTVATLEESVRKKSGRVKDLADRLHADEDSIEKLLEPASRVYKAGRGWLKIRG